MWLVMAGGFPMVVIAVVGGFALAGAARFAMAPHPDRLRHVVALSASVLCASVTGVCADLLAVSVNVPAHPEWLADPGLGVAVLVGVGESLVPAILGGSVLAAVALLAAVGLQRLPRET